MASLFESIDLEMNDLSNFWSRPDNFQLQDIEQKAVYSSNILFLLPNGAFKERKIMLTTRCLYFMDKITNQPKRMAVIIWKKLDFFNEVNDSSERFGFILGQQSRIHQKFYTKTRDDLNIWIEKLSGLVILNNLDHDYNVIKEIGSGNYARVYLGINLKEATEYAIKSINKELIMNNPLKISLIIDEITAMKKLKHPFLLALHRVYENDKYIHLILDYVSGGDLYERIMERKTFSEEKAALFMKNLFQAIDYMHSSNVIHRDLKPENILMVNHESDADFKIADFGFACELSEVKILRIGSPGYMAPEILKKKVYGEKADIFSAGVIMYVILSSKAPFNGKTRDAILFSNLECKIYFQDTYWKHISKEGIDLVLRLTDSDPENRLNAKQALSHPWLNMTHKRKASHTIVQIPEVDNIMANNEAGISSVLMKRMNDKRGMPNLPEKSKREEEEKLAKIQQALTGKKSKNLLMRLRGLDSSLN